MNPHVIVVYDYWEFVDTEEQADIRYICNSPETAFKVISSWTLKEFKVDRLEMKWSSNYDLLNVFFWHNDMEVNHKYILKEHEVLC